MNWNKSWYLVLTLTLLSSSCHRGREGAGAAAGEEDFSFVFLTDVHLQPELNAEQGFRQAIRTINRMDPDFVITGGDQIMDALGVSFERADSLYDLYDEVAKEFQMPVYNTLGNHEVFAYYPESGADTTHPFYGDRLYEARLGERYYAIDHKGWRFYFLDSVEEREERGGYFGFVDREQLKWLKKELAGVDTTTPLVLTLHIPLVTVQTQLRQGSTTPNSQGTVVTNAREVLELFSGHNLRLVLQGHLHAYEEIYANGILFITGGAVSGRWWHGPSRGVEEGFLLVTIRNGEIIPEYVDYGWTPVQDY